MKMLNDYYYYFFTNMSEKKFYICVNELKLGQKTRSNPSIHIFLKDQ